MADDKGRFLPLSRPRRMMCEWLRYSRSVPLAHGERRADLRPLREAVAGCRPRPNWLPMFFKAYAVVAAARPALRRCFVRYPWPRLYEHPENVGSVAVSRPIDGEEALLYLPIVSPELLPLAEIDARLKAARHLPVEQGPAFRRQLRLGGLPLPARRVVCHLGLGWMGRQRARQLGTFGMSCLASMGVANLSTLVPWTTMIHYTPFRDDGSVDLRIALDHRVLDGLEVAYALREMEEVLNTTIADEVRASAAARGRVTGGTTPSAAATTGS